MAVFPPDNRQRIVTVLAPYYNVYLDESYHQDEQNPSVFVLGGFVAYLRDWEGFDEEWRAVLSNYPIKAFHMHSWVHRKRLNKSPWNDDRYDWDALLPRLVKIINAHEIQPLAVWTRFQGRMRKKELAARYAAMFGQAVRLTCTGYVTMNGARAADEHDRFAYFLDWHDDPKLRTQARNTFHKQRDAAPWRRKLVVADFFDDEEYAAIQAADIIAFELSNRFKGELRGIQKLTWRIDAKRPIHCFEVRWPITQREDAAEQSREDPTPA